MIFYTFIFVLFLILFSLPAAVIYVYIGIMIWSLIGVRHSIQALTFLMLTKNLNPVIYVLSNNTTIYYYLILFVCATRIYVSLLISRDVIITKHIWLIIFSIYVMINSVLFSYYPLISFAKIFLFLYIILALLYAFQLIAIKRFDWAPWFTGMWVAVVLLSIPTLFDRSIGYARDDMGFQGILFHPQTLAVFLTPLFCWLMGRYVLDKYKLSYFIIFILFWVIAFIFLTLARTAITAIVISLLSLILFSNHFRHKFFVLFKGIKGISYFLLLVVLFYIASSSDYISNFIYKQSEADGIADAFHLSRGFRLILAWENFINHPIFGIGFGVTFEEYFTPVYDTLTGLPISATVEKSLLPIVLLEEVGIIGLILFFPFMYRILRMSKSLSDVSFYFVVVSCFFVNIGEAVLFSIAALGLYLWLIIGWALSWSNYKKIN